MNVEIGAEAALYPEKEYISGIFVAVHIGLVSGHETASEFCSVSNLCGTNSYRQMRS
jgi:hypothetical protein